MSKNTLQTALNGGVEYFPEITVLKDDTYTRIIHRLGNTDNLTEGFKFTIFPNGTPNTPLKYEIIKLETNKFNGFLGAIIQNTTPQNTETILWCDGSKGFDNPHTFGNDYEKIVDWLINDILGVGSNSIYPQLQSLKDFAEEFGVKNIDTGIGSSMAGIGMSTLAFTSGFENIKFRTYSCCTTDGLIQKIATHKEWGINLNNGANLESYYTPGEPLLKVIKPHIGNNKFYIKNKINKNPEFNVNPNPHSAEAYNNYDGNKSVYHPINSFNTNDFPLWKISPRFDKSPSMTGTGVCFKITFPVGKINKKETVKSKEEIKKVLKSITRKN